MQVMEWIGIAATVVLCVVLCALLIATVLEWFTGKLLQRRNKMRDTCSKNTREFLRTCLTADSWWFSEDPATQELVMDLANQQVSGESVGAIRTKWRERRVQLQEASDGKG